MQTNFFNSSATGKVKSNNCKPDSRLPEILRGPFTVATQLIGAGLIVCFAIFAHHHGADIYQQFTPNPY